MALCSSELKQIDQSIATRLPFVDGGFSSPVRCSTKREKGKKHLLCIHEFLLAALTMLVYEPWSGSGLIFSKEKRQITQSSR
jgi:hypothetical protein